MHLRLFLAFVRQRLYYYWMDTLVAAVCDGGLKSTNAQFITFQVGPQIIQFGRTAWHGIEMVIW